MDNLNTNQNNTQYATRLLTALNPKQNVKEFPDTGSSVSNVGTLAAAAGAAVNKMKKTMKSSSNKNQQVANTLSANKKTSMASTMSTTASATSSNTNNLSVSNSNKCTTVAIVHKHFQIPSDILDDLATRFIINVPDMELNNLIRVCFQIELAHWFYLDFFCSSNVDTSVGAIVDTEYRKVLQPLGLKNFALQLFKHIPFLSEHLPTVDKILEDWKNYKLSVPTYGAILISEDLHYCLLVQSYFAKTSWGFPKGKVNENEDPEHCATREVFEETGFDITNLIEPNDFIEAIINYQYTRLYIVCNVPLDTIFLPLTRNEIRSCNWFPIDSLPNNKNDAISKAKLGQNANSFFMILPFVKRLKKWVNEKRVKANMLELGADICSSLPSNENNTKTNQSRKYSNSCLLNSNINSNTNTNNNGANNAGATLIKGKGVASGAIPKSSSTSHVNDVNYLKSQRKVSNTTANGGKKQRQQQAANNVNVSNANNRKNINNVAGIFILSDIESTNFTAASANTEADTASDARSKRQRHKSMGDLDNMNYHNTANEQSNSCYKNSYKNHNQPQQQQQQQQYTNNTKRNAAQKMHSIYNENTKNSNGVTRPQLFHSQSQNDCGNNENYISSISDKSCIEQQVVNSFDLIRQKKNKNYGGRQRAKRQSEKQQQQQKQVDFCNNNITTAPSSQTTNNVQRQRSFINTQLPLIESTTKTNNDEDTINTDNANFTVGGAAGMEYTKNNLYNKDVKPKEKQEQQQRYRRYNSMVATNTSNANTEDTIKLTGNNLNYWSNPRTLSDNVQKNTTKAATSSTNATPTLTTSTNAFVEASAIESHLIQEQKLLQQLKSKPKQKQQHMSFAPSVQQQPHSSELTTVVQQQQQQYRHNPLQHSASSPGLATWKNFSFTKNLISNVFL